MSNISTILKQHAEDLRLASPEAVAVEHLKQAGYTEEQARYQVAQHVMEKEATAALTMKGVDHEDAVKLVKAANINVAELKAFQLDVEADPTVELLKQAADYIDALEAQIAGKDLELQKQASSYESRIDRLEHPIQLPEQLNKFASTAKFTREDLEQLQRVSPEVLEKIATAVDEPWGFGSGVGVARPKTDPFLEFLLN
jgi:phage terminase large subunit-like protein